MQRRATDLGLAEKVCHDAVEERMGQNARNPPTKVPKGARCAVEELAYKQLKSLEARVGIEPTHKGFADLTEPFMPVCTRCAALAFSMG